MRAVKDLRDVQLVLNELLDFKTSFESRNIDLNGRRIINAGESRATSDYVIRAELIERINQLSEALIKRIQLIEMDVSKLQAQAKDFEARLSGHGI